MSDFLRAHGIDARSPYHPDNLGSPDQVIIGNALSRGNPEIEAVREQRLPFASLPELIHTTVLADKLPIVVAGTHGKTTSTAALAQLLETAGFDPGYMIGGLPIGWEAGFQEGKGRWFAIEGDEYDSAFFDKRPKFLHYQPHVVLLNNIEFDHADIYSSLDEIFLQFARLIQLIPRNGRLIVNGDEPNLRSILEQVPCPIITFGLNDKAMVRADQIEFSPEGMTFKLHLASGRKIPCMTALWGRHQLYNLLGAAAAAEFAGATPEQIAAGVSQFRGVRRRLELKSRRGGVWLYDDFAHHPTAIRAALTSLRERHPAARLVAAIEPRSNTLVRHFFQDELAAALDLADRVLIGGLHREAKIPSEQRLDVAKIVEHLHQSGKEATHLDDPASMAQWLLEDLSGETVIVLMSNGAFSGLGSILVEKLGMTA